MPCRRHTSGFSLIEVIAALIILTIAVPPMLWSVRSSHRQRIDPMLVSQARWLITEKIEDIMADRHSSTRGYAFLIPVNYPPEASVAGFPGFSRTVALSETEADLVTPGSGYMIATVTVGWTDSGGVARSLPISTVLTEYAAP